MTSLKAKKLLRIEMREKRNALNPEWKSHHDGLIINQLIAIANQNNVSVIHTYLPIGSEININPAIDHWYSSGLKIICPKVLPARKLEQRQYNGPNKLEAGPFGTRHPIGETIEANDIELIIVPGLAFDAKGNRLGYGSGYYDAFLSNYPKALKVGVAYPFQVFDTIPIEEYDIRLDRIIHKQY